MTHRDLTAEEINSLLIQAAPSSTTDAAVRVGGHERLDERTDKNPSPVDAPVTSSNPVNKLPLGAAPAVTPMADAPGVGPVTQSDRLGAVIQRALDEWAFALQQPLRTVARFTVDEVVGCSGELLAQYESPTCIQPLQIQPLGAPASYIQLDMVIMSGMIDRLLGGGKLPTSVVRRGLTEIEAQLLVRLTAPLHRALERQFTGNVRHSISALRAEANPRCLPLQDTNACQVRVRVEWSGTQGLMRFILPADVVRQFLHNGLDNESQVHRSLNRSTVNDPSVASVSKHLRLLKSPEATSSTKPATSGSDSPLAEVAQVRVTVDRRRMYAPKLDGPSPPTHLADYGGTQPSDHPT